MDETVSFNKKNLVAVIAFVVTLSIFLVVGLAGYGRVAPENANLSQEEVGQMEEIQIEEVKEGTGETVEVGSTVNVNYRGYLEDGTEFDSSYKRNEPFTFTVGEGGVIEGWNQGLVGMKVGGTRKLTIPPSLGYGSAGREGVIPPNSTLIFEIELLSLEK